MKRTFLRAALAAVLSGGVAGTANAVPMYFDFTGTITNQQLSGDVAGAAPGVAISGGFSWETDRMFRLGGPIGEFGQDVLFTEIAGPALTAPLGTLAFGGRTIEVPAGGGFNYAGFTMADVCNASGCVPQWMEGWSVSAHHAETLAAGFTGTFTNYSFSVSSSAVPRGSGAPPSDYFDSTNVEPLSLLSMPLLNLNGYYNEFQYTCVAGECENTGQRGFHFDIDGVVRGTRDANSVPEPGTLGLLGAALGGMFLMRRRPRPAAVV